MTLAISCISQGRLSLRHQSMSHVGGEFPGEDVCVERRQGGADIGPEVQAAAAAELPVLESARLKRWPHVGAWKYPPARCRAGLYFATGSPGKPSGAASVCLYVFCVGSGERLCICIEGRGGQGFQRDKNCCDHERRGTTGFFGAGMMVTGLEAGLAVMICSAMDWVGSGGLSR